MNLAAQRALSHSLTHAILHMCLTLPQLLSLKQLRSATLIHYFLSLLCACFSISLPVCSAETSNTGLKPEFSFSSAYFDTISTNTTIPYGIVTAMLEDQQGLLWLGSQNGLVRYDGYHFRKFSHNENDPHSLVGDYIRALWRAPDGRLWIATFSDGLSVFDPATEKFENFQHDPHSSGSLSSNRLTAIYGAPDGGIWVGSEQGLDYLAPAAKSFIHFRHNRHENDSLLDDHVSSLLIDQQGNLWVGTVSGLQLFNPFKKNFPRVASDPFDASSLAGQEISALFQAADGKIWIGTQKNGVAWLTASQLNSPRNSGGRSDRESEHKPFELAEKNSSRSTPASYKLHRITANAATFDTLNLAWVNSFAQFQPNQLWLGTYGGGLHLLDANTGQPLQNMRHDPALASSLGRDKIGSLLFDKTGILRVGTWGGGLQHYNTQNPGVRMLRYSPNHQKGLSYPDIYSMLELQNGQILIGTSGNGIDIFDRQHGLIGAYRVDSSKPHGLTDGIIKALIQTSDGTVWAGSQQKGVFRRTIQPATGQTHWQSFDIAQGLPSSLVTKLFITKQGQLWAGTARGLALWQPALQRFESIAQSDGSPMQSYVYAITDDTQGNLWVGTADGLYVLETRNSGLHAIRHDAERASSLSGNEVTGLLLTSQNKLLVSNNAGLDELQSWNGKTADFKHITRLVRVPSNFEFRANLLEDNQGRIWVGDALFDQQKNRIQILSKADGFDIGTWWIGAYGKTRDGLIMLGGTLGIAIIDPVKFKPWNFHPAVRATELKINGKPTPLGKLKPHLELTPEQRNFAITFAALDYSEPKKNRYAYRLLPYDQEWIETDAEHRLVSYGNLWPGNYTLLVRGSNREGEWSDQQLQLSIHVLPAFWQSAWFFPLILVALSGLLYGGYRWRIKRLENNALALQELITARTADLLKIGEIGQQLTATLDTEQNFQRVYKQVSSRLDSGRFMIGILDTQGHKIDFVYHIEQRRRQQNSQLAMDQSDHPALWCIREKRELLVLQADQLIQFIDTVIPATSATSADGLPQMQTMVYLPLMLEQKVIGCLTVQSMRSHAYNPDQLEFLRVLTSYTAIALANSSAHGKLATAHADLANAHTSLQETQAQLIQSEKMASLGQLVANVAHEINTPIGAIKSSGGNIAEALDATLFNVPVLLKLLTEQEESLFRALITLSRTANHILSSREERLLSRQAQAELEQQQISNPDKKAAMLIQLRAHTAIEQMLPILRHPEADFILKTAFNISSIIRNTQNINLAVTRISKIVFSLKSLTFNSQGEWIESDLREGIESVLMLYQNQLKNGIELIRDFHPVAPLRCLPDELNQVWTNLIHNAMQAMNYRGILSIGLRTVDNCVHISISDTGKGMSEQVRLKIFEAFFTTKAIGEGSGLGLNIVKKIIEKHHGSISVESTPDVGTSFLVILPYTTKDLPVNPDKT